MNERINELAKQSGLVRTGDWGMKRWEGPRAESISDEDLAKFAELIIKECGVVVDDLAGGQMGGANAHDLYEHFGVNK